ncbi:MAG: hypothetical protein KAS49_02545 [Candidatus Cloacimonetes bacterium]|nr:hypothetical protein [Candidatus Cloacimonadota bacterium]
MKDKKSIEFRTIPIDVSYGKALYDVYIVIENDRCKVLEELNSLEIKDRADIIDIISKMATVSNFKSPKIRSTLKKYTYGEIKPKGHRVFYFRKCGNNIILFDYRIKKKDSLGDSVYKKLEKEKQYYEQEFTRLHK